MKVKKQYFTNLNEKHITDNRKFWQTVKSFLSKKNKPTEKIKLLKNEEIISNDVKVANSLNIFFEHKKNIPEKFADR